jgi:hypothetical protein
MSNLSRLSHIDQLQVKQKQIYEQMKKMRKSHQKDMSFAMNSSMISPLNNFNLHNMQLTQTPQQQRLQQIVTIKSKKRGTIGPSTTTKAIKL